jgi:hypothetical protein
MTSIFRAFILLCLVTYGSAQADQDLKEDAVQRVAHSHDPAIFVATGALYLKQEAIRANGGKPLPPAVDAEVERMIDINVRDPAWFYAAWAGAIDPRLSAEEADDIATHFTTEGGHLQRQVIEQSIGEVLTSTYTFTNKIDYRIEGSAREMQDLQRAVGPMRGTCACPTPKEMQELQRVADKGQYIGQDLSNYPEAVEFASTGVGVKYVKILMVQGVGAMRDHFESTAKQVRKIVTTQDTPK